MGASPLDVHPIYAVVGTSGSLRDEALHGILQSLGSQEEAPAVVRFNGADTDAATVLDEVRTPSLFGPRRAVIVDEADPFISTHRALLERYTQAPSDGGSLILLCRSLPRNTRLYRMINQAGAVIVIEEPTGAALSRWMMRRAQTRYGKRLAQAGADRLRDHLGDSVGAIDAELAKLAAYVGSRAEITPADIDALTGRHREEKVFAVTDAMLASDPAGALRHWEQVLATDRAAPARAIGGLAWAVRRLLEMRRTQEQGAGAAVPAARYGPAGMLEQRLARVSSERLEAWQRDLLAADLAVKTGAASIDTAVERFIVKHTA